MRRRHPFVTLTLNLRSLPYPHEFVQFCTNCWWTVRNMAKPEDPGGGGDFRGLAYGLQILVGVGIGYFVGRWLDRHYGWSNGVIIGSLIGLTGGLYLLIKDAIRINKD
jgi:cobalamin synthase